MRGDSITHVSVPHTVARVFLLWMEEEVTTAVCSTVSPP